ncbi:MAG: hypothetical protein RMK32_03990 [Anaerolineae bacterium]|nr:hypothetical protein [Thermoflexus sp.]MDW8064773.1 hypothetical protein [Anaerolineae bacterium]
MIKSRQRIWIGLLIALPVACALVALGAGLGVLYSQSVGGRRGTGSADRDVCLAYRVPLFWSKAEGEDAQRRLQEWEDDIGYLLRALATDTEIRVIAWRGEQILMMLYTPFEVRELISAFGSPGSAVDTLRATLERLIDQAQNQSKGSISGRIREIAWQEGDPPILQARIQVERRSRSAVPVTLRVILSKDGTCTAVAVAGAPIDDFLPVNR